MFLLLPSFLFLGIVLIFVISRQCVCQDLEKFSFDSFTNIFYAVYETAGFFLLVGLYWIGKLLSQVSSSSGCNVSILIHFEHCISCLHRIPLCHTLQCCHCLVFCCGHFPSQTTFASIYIMQSFHHRAWSACNNGTGVSQEILDCRFPMWFVLEQELEQQMVLNTGKI